MLIRRLKERCAAPNLVHVGTSYGTPSGRARRRPPNRRSRAPGSSLPSASNPHTTPRRFPPCRISCLFMSRSSAVLDAGIKPRPRLRRCGIRYGAWGNRDADRAASTDARTSAGAVFRAPRVARPTCWPCLTA
jgi:hypothetical protein